MTSAADTTWPTLPEIAERFGVGVTRIHRLIEERQLAARRVEGVLRVPEQFIDGDEPLQHLRGTLFLLADAGFSDDEAIDWLLTDEESLGTSPVEALRAGRKSEVRRVAQALA